MEQGGQREAAVQNLPEANAAAQPDLHFFPSGRVIIRRSLHDRCASSIRSPRLNHILAKSIQTRNTEQTGSQQKQR